MVLHRPAAAAAGLVLVASLASAPAAAQGLLQRGETIGIPTPPSWTLTLGALGGHTPGRRGLG